MSKESENTLHEGKMSEDAQCIGEISVSIMVTPEGAGLQLGSGCIDDASVQSVLKELVETVSGALVEKDLKMMLSLAALADPEKMAAVTAEMQKQEAADAVDPTATRH